MPIVLSARARRNRGSAAAENADGGRGPGGNRACYGIAACAVALLLFCALAVSVSVWMAFAFGGLALVAFAVVGFLARGSSSSTTSGGGGANAETDATTAGAAPRSQRQRRSGLPKAAIDALPTFAYERSHLTDAEGVGGDIESGTTTASTEEEGSSEPEPCAVCLEDIQAGEMVRQLPACKHLFHVECIDMWLHSHRTCPVCRCNLLPPPGKAAAKAPAAAPAPTTAEAAEPEPEPEPAADHDEALPPV